MTEYTANDELEEIQASIPDTNEKSCCDNVIIAGDFNIVFNRRNGHAKRLQSLMNMNFSLRGVHSM